MKFKEFSEIRKSFTKFYEMQRIPWNPRKSKKSMKLYWILRKSMKFYEILKFHEIRWAVCHTGHIGDNATLRSHFGSSLDVSMKVYGPSLQWQMAEGKVALDNPGQRMPLALVDLQRFGRRAEWRKCIWPRVGKGGVSEFRGCGIRELAWDSPSFSMLAAIAKDCRDRSRGWWCLAVEDGRDSRQTQKILLWLRSWAWARWKILSCATRCCSLGILWSAPVW